MRPLLVLCLLVLTGCQNGFSSFYHPNFDPKNLPPGLASSDLKYLDQNETPQIFSSNDLPRDVKIARSKYWLAIGYSSFNGAMGTQDQVIRQAKALGASMVLVTSQFTENRTITTPLFIPNNQTTYYNGTTNGQIYGNNGNSANYNSNTTGTATTYGTTVVPLTSVQARYNQAAVYFVRYTKQFKFGISTVPLTPELRAQYERNTGALVEIVFENTPAFNANILPGDIITELDGKVVENEIQFSKVFFDAHPANGLLPVKILRNGNEKTINVQLAP
jgi:serine protease Do